MRAELIQVQRGALSDIGLDSIFSYNPGPGRPERDWVQCTADDLTMFPASEGSTESSASLIGVEAVLRPASTKKSGKGYRGVCVAMDCFTARWLRHTAQDVKSGDKENGGVGRIDSDTETHTAVDECRNEMLLYMVWQGTGSTNK